VGDVLESGCQHVAAAPLSGGSLPAFLNFSKFHPEKKKEKKKGGEEEASPPPKGKGPDPLSPPKGGQVEGRKKNTNHLSYPSRGSWRTSASGSEKLEYEDVSV